ncbi:DUF1579 domain-containing protein [Pedobacter sp. UC225_61]|uniref:DUF1579 domain-containing protein n=1 Tax=Pedobacter sp. UC225_61 TaxID=3374623 RepID=UPI0037A741D8
MKRLTIASYFVLLLAVACNNEKKGTSADSAKVDTAAKTTTPVDTAAMNKAWAAYMAPGDPHKMMAAADGKWDAEITMYYSPDQPPSVNKAVCENKMILGGRYQQSTYKGSFEGMPFEGISTLAYDNSKKIYVSTWVDNMGTGVMYLEGTFDAATKTMNMKGKATDVVSGKDITIRETLKFIDDNTQQMEMFDTKDGKEVKTMSINLKRAK